MNTPLITPEPPDPLIEETRVFWQELGKSLIRESLGVIDDTAKQIIVVAGILEGLYFNAIAFSNLRGKVPVSMSLIIYLSPIVLLLFSLCAALLIFFPGHYRLNFHSSEASRLLYERLIRKKLLLFRISALCLVLGIVAIILAVLTYLRG